MLVSKCKQVVDVVFHVVAENGDDRLEDKLLRGSWTGQRGLYYQTDGVHLLFSAVVLEKIVNHLGDPLVLFNFWDAVKYRSVGNS